MYPGRSGPWREGESSRKVKVEGVMDVPWARCLNMADELGAQDKTSGVRVGLFYIAYQAIRRPHWHVFG